MTAYCKVNNLLSQPRRCLIIRHRDVKYVRDSSKLVNNPLFGKQTPLSKVVSEVEKGKKKCFAKLNASNRFFVYQYVKLRMLRLYYDCLIEYIDKSDFFKIVYGRQKVKRKDKKTERACTNKEQKMPEVASEDNNFEYSIQPDFTDSASDVAFTEQRVLEDVIGSIDPSIHSVYRENWESIKSRFFEPKKYDACRINHASYNIRWGDSNQDWRGILNTIFERQTKRFKINGAHSFILYNKETERYRFFYHGSQQVGCVLEIPKTVNNYQDFKLFVVLASNQTLFYHAPEQAES